MQVTKTLIMAVPFDQPRVRNAIRLAQETGGTIVWDTNKSISHTFLKVLSTAGEDPVIVLQDDVQLVEGWREAIEDVIAEHPDDVCQFFSLRKSDLTEGARYVAGSNYLMNQCYYLPATYARQIGEYAQQFFADNPGHTGDDTAIGKWLASRKERYWHHVPSLVQHYQWPSAINGRRSSKRQSPTFTGEVAK